MPDDFDSIEPTQNPDVTRDEHAQLPLDIEKPEPLLPLSPREDTPLGPADEEDDIEIPLEIPEADPDEAETLSAETPVADAEPETLADADADLADKPAASDDAAESEIELPASWDTAGAAEVPEPNEAGILASGEPRDMDLGPEKRIGAWVWAGVGALLALAVAAGGFMYYRSITAPVSVPTITGKNSAQATQTLNDAHLRLGEITSQPTATAPVGTVIGQKPKAGTTVDRDTQVSIVVAVAAESAKVPDVTGKTRDDAEATLAAEQLRAQVVETYSSTVSAGIVISQLPSATVEMSPGSPIALIVSRGVEPSSVVVPNLASIGEAEALQILESLDLAGVSYRSIAASVSAGDLVAQAPKAGTKVAAGSTVQVLYSSGRGTTAVAVPTVTGKTQADAEAALKSAGLKVVTRSVVSDSVKTGNVVAQMPAGASKAASGATVGLLVSKGGASGFTVPDLSGKQSSVASGTIAAAGYKPVLIGLPSKATAGTVFAQFPAAGAVLKPNFPVIAVYAK